MNKEGQRSDFEQYQEKQGEHVWRLASLDSDEIRSEVINSLPPEQRGTVESQPPLVRDLWVAKQIDYLTQRVERPGQLHDLTPQDLVPNLTDIGIRELIPKLDELKFFLFLSFFDFEKQQFNLSQQTVDVLFERYLHCAETFAGQSVEDETQHKDSRFHGLLGRFVWSGLHLTPQRRLGRDRENIADQILNAAVRFVKEGKHLQAIEQYLNLDLLQNPQMLRDETLYRAVQEIVWTPDLDFPSTDLYAIQKIRHDLVGWSVYNIAFGYEQFAQYFKDVTAQNISTNPTQTAKLLEMTRIIAHSALHQGHESAEQSAEALAYLVQSVAEKTDNYLLRHRAESIYREISRLLHIEWTDADPSEALEQEGLDNIDQTVLNYLADRYGESAIEAWLRFQVDEETDIRLTEEYEQIADYLAAHATIDKQSVEQSELVPVHPKLQPYVDQGYTVLQLAKGITGLYNRRGQVERCVFNADLNREDNLSLYKVTDLQLFTQRSSTNTEARHDLVQDFLFLSSQPFHETISEDFAINIGELDIRVQNYFLNYLKTASVTEVQSLAYYAKEFGVDFFTTFLSLEEGQEMGARIIEICQKYDQETVRQLFTKYTELFEASEQVRDYMHANFKESLANKDTLEQSIINNLLAKGKDLLLYASQSKQAVDLIHYLDGYKAEIQLFARAFQMLNQQNQEKSINLEEFKDVHIETISGAELNESQKQQLITMSNQQWLHQGALGTKIAQDFVALLQDNTRLAHTRFYTVQHGNDILTCFRLDAQPDGSLYFGSVLARPDIAGARIGETLLDQMFFTAVGDHRVTAHCSPQSPITSKYLGKFGFVATELVSYAEQNDALAIERVPNQHHLLSGKDYAALVDLLPTYSNPEDHNTPALLRQYHFPQDYLLFTQEASRLLNDKTIVITALQRKPGGTATDYDLIVGYERTVSVRATISPQEHMPAAT